MNKRDQFRVGLAINHIAMATSEAVFGRIKPYLDNIEQIVASGWIACSDRLPDENGYYLTYSLKDGYGIVQYKGPDDTYYKDYVDAWMPLPEPYESK